VADSTSAAAVADSTSTAAVADSTSAADYIQLLCQFGYSVLSMLLQF